MSPPLNEPSGSIYRNRTQKSRALARDLATTAPLAAGFCGNSHRHRKHRLTWPKAAGRVAIFRRRTTLPDRAGVRSSRERQLLVKRGPRRVETSSPAQHANGHAELPIQLAGHGSSWSVLSRVPGWLKGDKAG